MKWKRHQTGLYLENKVGWKINTGKKRRKTERKRDDMDQGYVIVHIRIKSYL